MNQILRNAVLLIAAIVMAACSSRASAGQGAGETANVPTVLVGAQRPDLYRPLLEGKKIGLFTNHTGVVNGRRTVDLLRETGLNVDRIFSPEHGIDGKADAGAKVASSVDKATGTPITSLYGKGVPDSALDAMMRKLDVIVVDIQDVGTRFYTYYITMLKLMNAAARTSTAFVVFDRPNPNGMIVDGPMLDMKYKSGVGALPIPAVHGLTLGEMANMIVGEEWLSAPRSLELTVIPCLNYTHSTRWELPVNPSPNLRSPLAIALYPSLCFFEGTPVSVGRGTDRPFTIYGHPDLKGQPDSFTPRSVEGAANPPCRGKLCHGRDLSTLNVDSVVARGIDLTYLIDAYNASPEEMKPSFFTKFFTLLAGTPVLQQMISEGKSAEEIKQSWAPALNDYRAMREIYLLYDE